MAEDLHPAYSAMSDEVLTEDPSPFATDKASDITVVICELFQQNVVSLKLHKDVLNKSEYFRQRFDADQDIKVLHLPACEIETSVVLAMLEYLYTGSIRSNSTKTGCTFASYHISLFFLSLRFYLPGLARLAGEALEDEEIGITDDLPGQEKLIYDLYHNRHGKNWEELRQAVMKQQAWKLIKMPRDMVDRLEGQFPGFSRDLAAAFNSKLMGGSEKKGWKNWKMK